MRSSTTRLEATCSCRASRERWVLVFAAGAASGGSAGDSLGGLTAEAAGGSARVDVGCNA